VEGLNASAEKARENLMRHIERVGKVAKRQADRRAAALDAAAAIA
jgi:hypothetical protein